MLATLITLILLSFKIKKDFTLPKKIKLVIVGFFVLVFSLLQGRNYLMAKKLKDNFKEVTKLANYSLSMQLKKAYPTDVLIKLKYAYNGIQKKKNYLKRVEGFKFQANKKDTLKEQEIYILVIG